MFFNLNDYLTKVQFFYVVNSCLRELVKFPSIELLSMPIFEFQIWHVLCNCLFLDIRFIP